MVGSAHPTSHHVKQQHIYFAALEPIHNAQPLEMGHKNDAIIHATLDIAPNHENLPCDPPAAPSSPTKYIARLFLNNVVVGERYSQALKK